jgi:PhnB protein
MTDSKDTYGTVTPYLVVPDADAELAFLKAAFGGTEANCQRNPDNTVMHAEIRIGDSLVMLGQAGGPWKPRPAALYLWVEDVDATYARALQAGATSESEPEDKPYGHRNAGVIDQNRRDVVDWRSRQVETFAGFESNLTATT